MSKTEVSIKDFACAIGEITSIINTYRLSLCIDMSDYEKYIESKKVINMINTIILKHLTK